jgi:hypothetical protein
VEIKVVKSKFKDQKDTGPMLDEDTAADAATEEDQDHSAQVRGPRGYQNNAG